MTHSNQGQGPLLFQGLKPKPAPCGDSPMLPPQKSSPLVHSPIKEHVVDPQLGGFTLAVDHGTLVDHILAAVKEENDLPSEEHDDEDEGGDEDPEHAPIADTGSDWQDQDLGLDQCYQGKQSVEQLTCNSGGQQMSSPVNWMAMDLGNAAPNETMVQIPATVTAYSDQMSTAIPQAQHDGTGYHNPSFNPSYLGIHTPCTWPTSTYQGQHGRTYDESAQYIGGTYSIGGNQWAQFVPPVIDINGVPIIPDNNDFAMGHQYNYNAVQPGPFNGTNMPPNSPNCSTPTNLSPLEVSTRAYETLMRTENKVNKLLDNLSTFVDPKELKKLLHQVQSYNASAFGNKNVPQRMSSMPTSPPFHHRRTERSPGRIPKLVRNPPVPKQGDPRSAKQIIAAHDRKVKVYKAKVAQRANRTIDNIKLDDKLDDINSTDSEDSSSIFSPALNTATMLKNEANKRIWSYFIRLNPKNNRNDMENVYAKLIAQSNPTSKPWSGIMSDIKAVSSDAFSAWEDITGTQDKIYDLFKDIPGVSIEVCRVEEEGNTKLMVFIPPLDANGKEHSWNKLEFAAVKVEGLLARQGIYDVDVEIWETDFQLVVV